MRHLVMLALLLNLVATLRSALRTRAEFRPRESRTPPGNSSPFATLHHGLSLGKDAPEPRPVQPSSLGKIVELPEVGGLHHRYERRAA